jgi:hypothetical protein
MPKIIKSVSTSNLSEEPFEIAFGPCLPENPLPPPPPEERTEIVVTPNPKTRQQYQDNGKARRHQDALARQAQAQPSGGQSKSQARRRRRQKRAINKLAVQSALAADRITKADAEKLLYTDRNRDNSGLPSE